MMTLSTKADDTLVRKLQETTELITEARVKHAYRPVGVAVVENEQGKLLLVQSAKNLDNWSFIQGGIEEGEDVITAVLRESSEEAGIEQARLTVLGYYGSQDLSAESSRRDKRGYTKGKRYFFLHLGYNGSSTLALQKSELAGYEWVERGGIANRLSTTRPEKREMLNNLAQKVIGWK